MEVIKTDIEGVVIIEPKVFDDARDTSSRVSRSESSRRRFVR